MAVFAGGAELLVEVAALGLRLKDAVGELENLRGRAVVGLDAVDDRAGMAGQIVGILLVLTEIAMVLRLGA